MEWRDVIALEREKEYFSQLKKSIDHKYQTTTVYPPREKIFRAFGLTKYDNLKVVIIGQDPYHGEGQAEGLAFSTPSNIKNPPSLQNILKEIESDIGRVSQNSDGDLTSWAIQGVLLINTILTVESAKAKSHHNLGWEMFTDNIITHINDNFKDIVFILWGSNAISMRRLIDESRHHILTAPHPSPLSSYRGFFGCRHFSKTNKILKNIAKDEILW